MFEMTASNTLSCLFTKHKAKKRKIWQDGRLVVKGGSCFLYAADPIAGSGDPVLDRCELAINEANALQSGHRKELETASFLITIEGPWNPSSVVSAASSNNNNNTHFSGGMTKLLQSKFRKPLRQQTGPIPPPHSHQRNIPLTRKRPLQPGELYHMQQQQQQQQRYYPPSPHPHGSCNNNNILPQQPIPMREQKDVDVATRKMNTTNVVVAAHRHATTATTTTENSLRPVVVREQHHTMISPPLHDNVGRNPAPSARQRSAVTNSNKFVPNRHFQASDFFEEEEDSSDDDEQLVHENSPLPPLQTAAPRTDGHFSLPPDDCSSSDDDD